VGRFVVAHQRLASNPLIVNGGHVV
jgi:hypothetical protein